MAQWSGNKVDPSLINGGNEYVKGNRLSREAINAIVNNSLYASDASAEALEKANSAFMSNGTVVYVGDTALPTLNFISDPQEQISSKEQVVLVYDKDGGLLLDWGITGGIVGTLEVVSNETRMLDFSKYKKLIILSLFAGIPFIYELDLTTKTNRSDFGDYKYSGVGSMHSVDDILSNSSSMGIYFSWAGVNENKNAFIHRHIGYTLNSTITLKDNESNYIIAKIWGVL